MKASSRRWLGVAVLAVSCGLAVVLENSGVRLLEYRGSNSLGGSTTRFSIAWALIPITGAILVGFALLLWPSESDDGN